ncbi:unnamed protein product [Parnassius apollo]|uniref:(apollo) hypothetical protein n=1 Tax=Parnassius apollo TaxID=110799 RepID=A0A8S3XFL5_PARAO|nr:unnamed protein product [Parnassius apollo]
MSRRKVRDEFLRCVVRGCDATQRVIHWGCPEIHVGFTLMSGSLPSIGNCLERYVKQQKWQISATHGQRVVKYSQGRKTESP